MMQNICSQRLNYHIWTIFSSGFVCVRGFKDCIYLFLERREGREKERERQINVWLPLMCLPTGNLACQPGMCPDWDSNQQTFGSKAGTQLTEPHQPGLCYFFQVTTNCLDDLNNSLENVQHIYYVILLNDINKSKKEIRQKLKLWSWT